MSACEEMKCIEGDCIRQNRGAAGAPKERKDSARGFNPGCNVLTGRALTRGIKIVLALEKWGWMAECWITAPCPNCTRGRGLGMLKGHQMELEWSNPRNISVRKEIVRSRATFPPSSRIPELRRTSRGHPFTTDNPGLKPRAESFRPFGAAQTSLSRLQFGHASAPLPHHSPTPLLHCSTTPLVRAPRSSTSTTPLIP
jgi:hypothetical protein